MREEVAGFVVVVLPHEIRDHAQQANHRTIVARLEGEIDLGKAAVSGIERTGAIGQASWRHPTGGTEREVVGVQVADAGITGNADVS